jgi:predicted NAD/FAD-dependent oxidoreductase
VTQQLRKVKAVPVFSLLLCVERKDMLVPFDGAAVCNSDTIQWVARDTSKPGTS